jgi:hypothetical protein
MDRAMGWVGGKNCQKTDIFAQKSKFLNQKCNFFAQKCDFWSKNAIFIHFLVDRPLSRGRAERQKFPLEGAQREGFTTPLSIYDLIFGISILQMAK